MERGVSFNISAFMQEQICFLGQEKVFEGASECFFRLCGLSVNAKQIERVFHHY